MLEDTREYIVSIGNNQAGVPLNVCIVAQSTYHAIDKVFNKYNSVQPDRSQYKIKNRWKKRK